MYYVPIFAVGDAVSGFDSLSSVRHLDSIPHVNAANLVEQYDRILIVRIRGPAAAIPNCVSLLCWVQ
jgi:hypothetical protein